MTAPPPQAPPPTAVPSDRRDAAERAATERAATGARVASLAAELRGAGVPAGVTEQVASVVRTAGLDAVIGLGAGMLTDEQAGAVLLDALIDARRRGSDSAETAAELRAVARLQTVVLQLLSGLATTTRAAGTGDRP
ncbi:hypothetical protein [Plantibacter cousiniae (nom. nud.)]|uniref:hypothetical protein n=1 Tax=Plantibacter cousiniae (nom. nud.) TaxID=199709 RepID=UPI001DF45372|nr:hypothetical protein [Plantibacter cousiniae]CAH0238815.1 hypothetical protein SRABI02_02878 [Plantibacter cousiniae]